MSDPIKAALREAADAMQGALDPNGCVPPSPEDRAAAAVAAFHRRMAEHWKGFAPDWQARHTQMADSVARAAQEDSHG